MANIEIVNYVGYPAVSTDKPFLLTCQYQWKRNFYSQTTASFDTVEDALFMARVNRAGWWSIVRREDGIRLAQSKLVDEPTEVTDGNQ
jgi:hypothetical protein